MLSPVSSATWPIFAAWLTASLAPITTLHSGVHSRVKRFLCRATASGAAVCRITPLPLSLSLTKGIGRKQNAVVRQKQAKGSPRLAFATTISLPHLVWPENPTRALRRPLSVSGDCTKRRYFGGRIQLSWGTYNRAVHFGLSREHQAWKAPVRVLLYGTGWRTRTAVTISAALAHDWIAQAAAR